MIKLYKCIKGELYYHEAWASGSKITEHWGKVGERGESVEHKRNKKLTEDKNLEQVLAKPHAKGYAPIDEDDLEVLLIEFPVEGHGTVKDLDKRHALEE